MSPPLLVTPEEEQSYAIASVLWMRLLVEVVHNPNYKNTDCKREVGQEYALWKDFQDAWADTGVLSRRVADRTQLNQLVSRARELAKSCLPNVSESELPKNADIHGNAAAKAAQWVDINAPGGAPPPDGGVLGTGLKPATAVLLGVGMVGAGLGLKWLLR